MKISAQLKAKILSLTSEAKQEETPLRRIKAIKKRLTFLRFCLMYIESNPSEDCVKRQASECERQINIYDSRYSDWVTSNNDSVKEIRNIRAYYDKMNGIPKLREQIKTLGFILSKSNP